MALSSWNFPFCVPAVEVCSALPTGNAKTKPTMNNSTFVSNIPMVSLEISLSPFTDSIFCWLFLIFKHQPARNWQQLWDNCFFSSPSCWEKKNKRRKEFKEIACVKWWSKLHNFGKHHRIIGWLGLKGTLKSNCISPYSAPPASSVSTEMSWPEKNQTSALKGGHPGYMSLLPLWVARGGASSPQCTRDLDQHEGRRREENRWTWKPDQQESFTAQKREEKLAQGSLSP